MWRRRRSATQADLGGVGGQPAGELAQHALDAHHRRGSQRQPHLGDVAGQGGRQLRRRRRPLRGPLGRAVRAGLAGRGVEHAEVEQGGLQSEQCRAQRLGAVAAGPVTADGGGQRLPALVDDGLGHLPGGQPGDSAVTLASADHCRRVTIGSKPSSAEVAAKRS